VEARDRAQGQDDHHPHHPLPGEAEALSDHIGILHRGRLAALGTAEEIVRKSGAASFEDAFLSLTDEEASA
jgi:ABC-2 type transport system ATP-binding protein